MFYFNLADINNIRLLQCRSKISKTTTMSNGLDPDQARDVVIRPEM